MSSEKYEPLTIETLADRLGSVDVILVAQTMGLNTPNVDIRD